MYIWTQQIIIDHLLNFSSSVGTATDDSGVSENSQDLSVSLLILDCLSFLNVGCTTTDFIFYQ